MHSNLFSAHIQHHNLIVQLIKRDVTSKFKGAILGWIWPLLMPALTLAMYTIVFGYLLHSRWPGSESITDFSLILFPGLLLFTLFSESINRSTTLITTNPNFVKKVVFPIELLVWVPIGSALFHMLLGCLAWSILALVINGYIHWTIIFFPLVLAPFILMLLGASWFLSGLGVYVKDISQLTQVLTQVLMFFSPILYPLESLPTWALNLIYLNPLSFIVDQLRQIMNVGNIPDLIGLLTYTLVSCIVCILGFRFFQAVRPGFADTL